MSKYKIVYLKKDFFEMVEKYPILVSMLYSTQNNHYEAKQIDLLFSPIHNEKQKLLDILNNRIQTFITTTSIDGIEHNIIKHAKKIYIKKYGEWI